jgi:hypothetical protein
MAFDKPETYSGVNINEVNYESFVCFCLADTLSLLAQAQNILIYVMELVIVF